MAAKISIRVLLCCALVLGLAAPGFAWENNSEQPGSVLVFHKFVTLLEVDDGLLPDTEFEISVTCPKGASCSEFGQPVRIRLHWVCPGDLQGVCTEVDFNLSTTVNGTVVFHTTGEVSPDNAGHVPPPPCDRGYLIAWVINEYGDPIKFDGLIGDAVIRNGPTSARAYNALPIQAAEWLNTGDLTDGNGPVNGALDFDGNEYRAITGKIHGTVRYEDAATQTDLTLLTLDVRSNDVNDATRVGLNFFNEHEELISSATNFTCWQEVRVRDLPGNPDAGFGRKGLVESTGAVQVNAAVTLVGIVETVETVTLPVPVPGQRIFLPVITVPLLPAMIPLPPGCARRDVPALMPTRTEIRCSVDVPFRIIDFPALKDHAYSLFNDGEPVPTTFVPSLIVIPN